MARSEPRASPAYYPPRETRNKLREEVRGGVVIRPLSLLAGHGDGAVFDVKLRGEGMISAGEDGSVSVWGIDNEDQDGSL